MNQCIRCVVKGRVQGVFFRASTQRRAESLQITGHAHNRPDGSVEVLACGKVPALRQLKEWMAQGPDAARVEAVDCEAVNTDAPSAFTTG